MHRRALLGALGAAAIPRLARAQSLPVLRVASTTDEDVLAALYGRESGLFTKAGIAVDLLKGNNGAAVAAGVVGGAIDVGKSSTMGLVNAHAKAIPFTIVAPCALYVSEIGNSGLVVAKDSPIKTGRDLNGRTLSVAALHDLFSVAMSAWIDQHGGDSRTVKFLELPNSAAPEAVATGRVDAATIANPHLSEALAAGKVRLIGQSFDAIAKRFWSAAFFCTDDFLARNRDTMPRFRRALFEAAAYVNGHPVETAPLLGKYTGIDPSVIATMPRTALATTVDPRLLQPVIDRAVEYKAIPKPFDAREMVDPAATAG